VHREGISVIKFCDNFSVHLDPAEVEEIFGSNKVFLCYLLPKPTPAPPPSPAPTPISAPNNTSSLRRSTRSTAGKGVTQLTPHWSGKSYDSSPPAAGVHLAPPSHFHEFLGFVNCAYIAASDRYDHSYASILAAKSNTKDPDLLSFEQAMASEDRE